MYNIIADGANSARQWPAAGAPDQEPENSDFLVVLRQGNMYSFPFITAMLLFVLAEMSAKNGWFIGDSSRRSK